MTSGGYDPNFDPTDNQGGYPPPGPYPPPTPSGVSPKDLLPLRFGARLLDGLFIGIVASILVAIFGTIGDITITGVLVGILGFVYFVAMEKTRGATLGKQILGLGVRGPHDAPRATLQQSAIRNAFLLLGIIPVIGSLLVFVAYVVIAVTVNNSPTARGKHDHLAGGTQVVKN